jgi:hypothetical protein
LPLGRSLASKLNLIKRKQKTALVLAGAVLLIIGISTIYPTAYSGPSSAAYAAAQTVTTVEKIPVEGTVFVPCAADGSGEDVHLAGKVNSVFHVTLDNAGGAHVKVHQNDQGISGTGLTTGDKYQRTGATNFEFNSKVGEEQTLVFTFNFIGQGNGNNFLLHGTLHVTVNANGIVTADVDNISAECK